MSYKQVPITAKILKTTKGGVTQPLLNMGADVTVSGLKMKAPSVAKKKFLTKHREKVALAKDRSNYEKAKKQDALDKSRPLEEYLPTTRKAVDKRIKGFESKFGARVRGESGWDADDKARKNKTGIYKPTTATTVNTNSESTTVNTNSESTTSTAGNGKKSYDQAYKDTRGHKVYGKMDKATYIKEAKRQNASKKAGKGWDASGKGKTVNISNNVSTSNTVEPTSKVTKKQEATQSAKNNVAVNTKKKVNTKVTAKPTSRQVRKNASADRKDKRAARVRQKGIDALASGDTKKALRLKRRETRIKNRAAKKRGQAAGAIQPK